VAASIDLVVHAELERGGHRRVSEIVALSGEATGGVIESVPLFSLDGDRLVATGRLPSRRAKFDRNAVDVASLLGGGAA
jgi:pilus assembly protein CpaF